MFDFQSDTSQKRLTLYILSAIFVSSVLYWIRNQPTVSGVDFLFYLLTSRDLLSGIEPNPYNYIYFPGVYEFWKAAYRLADGSLNKIQWSYLSVVIANGILVGLILLRSCRNKLLALFGSSCYLILASRSEAVFGITEPLATLPMLFAMLLIFPSPKLDYLKLSVLGLGIASAIFMKQQCGLVALGVIGLMIAETPESNNIRGKILTYLPRGIFLTAASLAFLFVLFQLHGSGVPRILMGIKAVGDYESSGNFIKHLIGFNRALHGYLVLFFVVGFYILFSKDDRKYKPNSNLILFCFVGAFFSLVQFWKRGYLHYGLIPLPFMIIAVSAFLPLVKWEHWLARIKLKISALRLSSVGLMHAFMSVFTSMIFVSTGVFSSFFKPLPDTSIGSSALANEICQHLQPGADVFVYPAIYNEVHWLCKTRLVSSPLSYGWHPIDRQLMARIIDSPTINAVVLMKDEKNRFRDQTAISDFKVDEMVEILKAKNLNVIDLKSATVFQFRNN